MMKNLKIDIIYYNTPSDFEFEFNLGGYCRCRILNSKCATLKETVNKLALAVTRSTVVIIVGKLLGENGFVAPVAKSIGKNLAPVDHRKYHITNPEPISLVEGSLPLVTQSGEFGGSIIESGPQSIIMLTDDKHLREKISSELLSFYLTSLSRLPDDEFELIRDENTVKNDNITNEEVEQKAEDTTEDIIDITETTEKEIEAVNETAENIDISSESNEIMEQPKITEESDNTEETKNDATSVEIIDEVSNDSIDIFSGALENNDEIFLLPDQDSTNELSTYTEDNDISDLLFNEDTSDETESVSRSSSKKSSALSTVLLVLTIILLLIAAALLYFVVYLPGLDGINALDYIKEIFAIKNVGDLLIFKI